MNFNEPEKFVRENQKLDSIEVLWPGIMWMNIHIRESALRTKYPMVSDDQGCEHTQSMSVLWDTRFTKEFLLS